MGQSSIWSSDHWDKYGNINTTIGGWVAKAMFAGTSLSGQTVTRMYFLHVFILPVIVTTLIIAHLFIVWVQGIAEPH